MEDRCYTNPRLSNAQKAGLIEDFVNNPDVSLAELGRKYQIFPSYVSYLISKIWFYKKLSNRRKEITIQSSINEVLRKTA